MNLLEKVGIVGIGSPSILIAADQSVSEIDLMILAEARGISREQIEVVSKENFAERSKELTKTMEYVIPPKPIEPKDFNWVYSERFPKLGTGRDDAYYSNKIIKRRKKNKNKKTHRIK